MAIDTMSAEQNCERWHHRLDAKYGTTPDSPLHHDNRCGKCAPFMAERLVFIRC